MELRDLLENNNQAPINPNIIKIEENSNEITRFVVICSEIEVTNGSCEVKNGFNAFKYLKEGRGRICPSVLKIITPIPETMNVISAKKEFLIRVASLLNI